MAQVTRINTNRARNMFLPLQCHLTPDVCVIISRFATAQSHRTRLYPRLLVLLRYLSWLSPEGARLGERKSGCLGARPGRMISRANVLAIVETQFNRGG